MEFSEKQWARLEEVFGMSRPRLQEAIDVMDEVDFSPGAFRDRAGWPVSLGQAVMLATDAEYRQVAVTQIESINVVVSTVWIGWMLGPALFETAVFPVEGDRDPLVTVTYSSEEDARAGHRETLAEWSTNGSRCPDCGTLLLPHRKFNGGNPITVWLAECGCQDARDEIEVDAFVDRVQQRGATKTDESGSG